MIMRLAMQSSNMYIIKVRGIHGIDRNLERFETGGGADLELLRICVLRYEDSSIQASICTRPKGKVFLVIQSL
jgi:hypothetical protein